MKKKNLIITMVLITGIVFGVQSAFALNDEKSSDKGRHFSEGISEEASDYQKYSGVVSKVENDGDLLKLYVERDEDYLMIFPFYEEVLLFDRSGNPFAESMIEEGMVVDAYYDKRKPVMMIYPLRIQPKLMIVHGDDEVAHVKVSKYDENFLSVDGEIKLTISEETLLQNDQGEEISKTDLAEKELVVFYTFTTKSIPPQTIPQKIIAFSEDSPKDNGEEQIIEEDNRIEQIITEDHYIINGTKMVPLRKVAEALGYDVNWQHEKSRAHLRIHNRFFYISPTEKTYSYDRSIRNFEVAPEIIDGKMYVPEEFFEML